VRALGALTDRVVFAGVTHATAGSGNRATPASAGAVSADGENAAMPNRSRHRVREASLSIRTTSGTSGRRGGRRARLSLSHRCRYAHTAEAVGDIAQSSASSRCAHRSADRRCGRGRAARARIGIRLDHEDGCGAVHSITALPTCRRRDHDVARARECAASCRAIPARWVSAELT